MRKPPMTPEQRAARRHAQSAVRKNAKIMAEVPLFAEQLPQHTAENEFWHWRRNRAEAGERMGMFFGHQMLNAFTINRLRRHLMTIIDPEMFAKLEAKCVKTYPGGPGSSYYSQFWGNVLQGKRIEFSYKNVEGWKPNAGMGPCLVCDGWYELPSEHHMTREAFYAEYPYMHEDPIEEPDHGGVIARAEEFLQHFAAQADQVARVEG